MTGFHLDEDNHWVADLSCGHTQHVRHNPPWQQQNGFCQIADVMIS
ncbi:DUF3565 domain-containing protein [Candidatus Pseudothioglobus sp. Uisw_016]